MYIHTYISIYLSIYPSIYIYIYIYKYTKHYIYHLSISQANPTTEICPFVSIYQSIRLSPIDRLHDIDAHPYRFIHRQFIYKGDTSTHAHGTDPRVALGAQGELPWIYSGVWGEGGGGDATTLWPPYAPARRPPCAAGAAARTVIHTYTYMKRTVEISKESCDFDRRNESGGVFDTKLIKAGCSRML